MAETCRRCRQAFSRWPASTSGMCSTCEWIVEGERQESLTIWLERDRIKSACGARALGANG